MLHYDEDVLMVFKDIQESDDVGMLADLEDLYFSLVELEIFRVHLLFLQNFDGHFFPSLLMNTKLNSSKFTFTNRLLELVVR